MTTYCCCRRRYSVTRSRLPSHFDTLHEHPHNRSRVSAILLHILLPRHVNARDSRKRRRPSDRCTISPIVTKLLRHGLNLRTKGGNAIWHTTCKRKCLVLEVNTTAGGCKMGMQDQDSPQSCVLSVHISFRVQAPGKLMGLVKRCRSMRGKGGNWHKQGTQAYTMR